MHACFFLFGWLYSLYPVKLSLFDTPTVFRWHRHFPCSLGLENRSMREFPLFFLTAGDREFQAAAHGEPKRTGSQASFPAPVAVGIEMACRRRICSPAILIASVTAGKAAQRRYPGV